ncbi:uncharacterized protein LOC125944774 [Dermacentor silvarum]|uniref:uncharacterized protein LOC125944774 n=1 Tax=Dermacentor silvarum TaxID=543639 RepID=UPI0021010705|nr:uncharacterized protein LOC125944774 [Dermacentor silvarum]
MWTLTVGMKIIIVTVLLRCSYAFLDYNPELGAYQDDGKCLNWSEPWYVVYRNYEDDPVFGDSTYCAYTTVAVSDPENSVIWTKEQGETTRYLKNTILSSPGYTSKDLVHVESAEPGKQPGEHPEIDVYMRSIYINCNSCKVFRHLNIDAGAGCTLWKPKSKINQRDACCEFIYDLLCGTSPKYHISDNCS